MDIVLLVLKFVSLFLTLTYGTAVAGDIIHGNAVVQSRVFVMAFCVTSFIFLQWIV